MHHAAVSRLPALYARLPPQLSPPPAYVAHRIQMYDGIKAKRDAELKSKERTPIKVTLRDGKELDGRAWETTPFNIAESLSKSLANNTVIARLCWVCPARPQPEQPANSPPIENSAMASCWCCKVKMRRTLCALSTRLAMPPTICVWCWKKMDCYSVATTC